MSTEQLTEYQTDDWEEDEEISLGMGDTII